MIRARAIVRLVKEARWDTQRRLEVSETPLTENSKHMDLIESQPDSHAHPDRDLQGDPDPPSRRRVKITLQDLKQHGFSPNCPRCGLHQSGHHHRTRFRHHTELCRHRIHQRLGSAGLNSMIHADA